MTFGTTLVEYSNSEERRNRSDNIVVKRNNTEEPATKTGLKNLGNTCYMNSVIQCLNNACALAKHFNEERYSEELNLKSAQRGDIAVEFGAVVQALWCGRYRSIAMWDLKSTVGRHHKPFQGYDQHDAHEFLIKFLDWMHDDLNQAGSTQAPLPEQNFNGLSDREAAQRVSETFLQRDTSVVCDLFHGLHRSAVICLDCGNRSLTFEPFAILTLSFPVSGRCTLKDMLYDFYKETRIEYKCSKCRRMRTCTRKYDIWKLPPTLIIHLNRFEHDILTTKKQNFVDFPLENLDLSEFTAENNSFDSFDLFAVSNHIGTMDGGHYTAFCRSPLPSATPGTAGRGEWSKFDDHEVYDLPRQSVKTAAAYILFYEARPLRSAL